MGNLNDYNKYFYEKQLLESKKSAEEIVPLINNWIHPTSVVDIGCGVGAWLDVWKRHNADIEVKGIDAKFVDKSLLLIDAFTEFEEFDLNLNLSPKKKYDLAMCLEVAEHLTATRANSFINDLTQFSDIILFSAAIPGQEGTDHVNEQFLDYWIKIFEENDYSCYDTLRPLIWDKTEISWWFKQNIVLFVKNGVSLNIDLENMQSFNCFDLVRKELLIHKTNRIENILKQRRKNTSYIVRILQKFF
ncbi:methyltransferase domain-containing protein [Christiangramia aquimixticola]|uniref:methyltransferase domain-containing protein n=1 Tax=Christiangramia aquimixticola TaxID=1697558 RepID=UPI003AA898D9